MTLISDSELSSLASLEHLYGALLALVERYDIEPKATSIKISGRYSNDTWTLTEMLDRTDEVLERAKERKLAS